MAYQPIPQQTEGTKIEATTSDDNAQLLLQDILKELKKMNLHLSVLTDMTVRDQEVN